MNHGKNIPCRRGFSVLELTIAIAILGVMMAVAGIALLPALGRAKEKATRNGMLRTGEALIEYKVNNGAFPQDLSVLVPNYLDSRPLDGWDQEYFYSPQGATLNTFILISKGEDGQDGTEDDIRYSDLKNQQ